MNIAYIKSKINRFFFLQLDETSQSQSTHLSTLAFLSTFKNNILVLFKVYPLSFILDTYPPTISGPLILNIVRAEQFNLTISASSNSSTNLTYSLRTNGTSVTSSNSATGVFTLVVTQQTNFSVEYVVSDENANTALLRPTLYYCYCLNNATCNASQANLFSSASDVYINYRACSCTPGYEGAFCETLVNLCEQNPCFTNVSCTDNHVTNTADCDSCPANYVGDGRQCTGM